MRKETKHVSVKFEEAQRNAGREENKIHRKYFETAMVSLSLSVIT